MRTFFLLVFIYFLQFKVHATFDTKAAFQLLQEQRLADHDEKVLQTADSIINNTDDKKKYPDVIFSSYYAKAEIHQFRGDPEQAIKNLIDASNYLHLISNKAFVYRYYLTLGIAYYAEQDYESALKQFYISLHYCKLATHFRDRYWVQNNLDNIGLCYFKLQNYKLAEYYYRKAIDESKKTSNSQGMVVALTNLAKLYLTQNKTSQAIALFKEAITINNAAKLFLPDLNAEINISLLGIYIEQFNHLKVVEQIKLLESVKQHFSQKNFADYYLDLSNYQFDKKDYENAYKNLIQSKHIYDSLNNAYKKINLTSKIFENYQEEYSKAEYETLEENEEIAFIILYIAILLLIIILFYIVNSQKIKIKNKQLKELNDSLILEKQKQEKLNIQLQNSVDLKDYSIATIAHDIRNPIGSIKLLAEILKRDIADERVSKEDFAECFDMIHKSAVNGLDVINELLESAKINNIKDINKVPLNLDDVLANVLNDLKQVSIEKQITIEIETIEKPIIEGDPIKLYRVFENLISNAIKFSYPKSKITITLSNTDSEIVVAIKDSGTGIDSEHLNSLFDPFNKHAKQGTSGEKTIGLGLSITKRIVEIHHGKVWVESKLNEGSVFYVALKK
ncbi:MAG: tetratricopeptide repeat-containing sensor histidine kinase [Bacteroidota bacterium]